MMTIDGNSIGYRNHTVDMTSGTVTDASDWTRTTQMPVLASPRFGLKTCTVTIKIPSVSHQDAWNKADSIIKKAKGFHIFGFDGISHSFRGILTGTKQEQLLPEKLYRLTLTMKGQEVGDEQEKTFDFSSVGHVMTIENEGTAWSPARVSISGMRRYDRITGLLRDPVTMQDMPLTRRPYYFSDTSATDITRNNIVLDGITGTFLWHDDTDRIIKTNAREITEKKVRGQLWDWAYTGLFSCFGIPLLAPGETEIVGSAKDSIQMTVTFRPVYM